MSIDVTLERIDQRWQGRTVVIAATGPSLTPHVAWDLRGQIVVAVSDAWRVIPWAEVLYSCDAAWWNVHKGAPGFAGERWSCHGGNAHNDKAAVAKAYGVRLVAGAAGDGEGFSTDPGVIHFGHNSGFQACNFALLAGAARLVLVGFDMQAVDGQRHFFGDHPRPLHNALPYGMCIAQFNAAAKSLPAGVEVLNATKGSKLRCFPFVHLADALQPKEMATA